MTEHKEAPHIQDAIFTLLTRWGDQPWLIDAVQKKDDGGLHLEVQVVDHLYVDDIVPRRLVSEDVNGDPSVCFLVVVRVRDPLADIFVSTELEQ